MIRTSECVTQDGRQKERKQNMSPHLEAQFLDVVNMLFKARKRSFKSENLASFTAVVHAACSVSTEQVHVAKAVATSESFSSDINDVSIVDQAQIEFKLFLTGNAVSKIGHNVARPKMSLEPVGARHNPFDRAKKKVRHL